MTTQYFCTSDDRTYEVTRVKIKKTIHIYQRCIDGPTKPNKIEIKEEDLEHRINFGIFVKT